MLKTPLALVLVTLLTGCASYCRTQIAALGPDTYQGSGVCGAAKEVEDAGPFCASMGKQVLVMNTRADPSGGVTVFRCLAAGDPALRRPVYQPVPAVTIEDRRK